METTVDVPAAASRTSLRREEGPAGARSVLVTGCSSGFGLRTAVTLAEQGWQVFASMRDLGRRSDLEQAAGGVADRMDILQLDVCDPSSVKAAVAGQDARTPGRRRAQRRHRRRGVLRGHPGCRVPRRRRDELLRRRGAHPRGASRHARQGHGRIVVISSVAAFIPQPALSAYASSKWAVEAWAESLAIEVGQFGVDVVLVEPGTYKTNIWNSGEVAQKPVGPLRRARRGDGTPDPPGSRPVRP